MNEESPERVKGSMRATAYIVTFFFVLLEWLMFELIRMPYRSPVDMLTLLGTEKYGVVLFMVMVDAGWLGFASYYLYSCTPNWRHGLRFCAYSTVLAAILLSVVFFPSWPVTPFELLWR